MKQATVRGYPIELGITASAPEIPPSHQLLTPEQQKYRTQSGPATYGRETGLSKRDGQAVDSD